MSGTRPGRPRHGADGGPSPSTPSKAAWPTPRAWWPGSPVAAGARGREPAARSGDRWADHRDPPARHRCWQGRATISAGSRSPGALKAEPLRARNRRLSEPSPAPCWLTPATPHPTTSSDQPLDI